MSKGRKVCCVFSAILNFILVGACGIALYAIFKTSGDLKSTLVTFEPYVLALTAIASLIVAITSFVALGTNKMSKGVIVFKYIMTTTALTLFGLFLVKVALVDEASIGDALKNIFTGGTPILENVQMFVFVVVPGLSLLSTLFFENQARIKFGWVFLAPIFVIVFVALYTVLYAIYFGGSNLWYDEANLGQYGGYHLGSDYYGFLIRDSLTIQDTYNRSIDLNNNPENVKSILSWFESPTYDLWIIPALTVIGSWLLGLLLWAFCQIGRSEKPAKAEEPVVEEEKKEEPKVEPVVVNVTQPAQAQPVQQQPAQPQVIIINNGPAQTAQPAQQQAQPVEQKAAVKDDVITVEAKPAEEPVVEEHVKVVKPAEEPKKQYFVKKNPAPAAEQPQEQPKKQYFVKKNPAPAAQPAEQKKQYFVKKNPAPATEPKKAEPVKKEEPKAAPVAPKAATTSSSADNLYKDKARVYHIARSKDGEGWHVKLAKGEKAIKVFPTQAEAIAYGKQLVATQGGSIRVHSMTGAIRKA